MKEVMKLCDRCGKRESTPLHNCPYMGELSDNPEFECNCCEVCEDSCYYDI